MHCIAWPPQRSTPPSPALSGLAATGQDPPSNTSQASKPPPSPSFTRLASDRVESPRIASFHHFTHADHDPSPEQRLRLSSRSQAIDPFDIDAASRAISTCLACFDCRTRGLVFFLFPFPCFLPSAGGGGWRLANALGCTHAFRRHQPTACC